MRRVRSGRIPLQQRAGEADRRAEGTSGAARIGGKKLYDRPPFRGEYGGTILEVSAHGTAVPLNRFLVSRGFTPGESFTSFTVEKAGTYFMTYDVRTVQAASLKSRIVKNGVPLPETVRACSGGNSCFFASSICILNAGDVLALQLYSLDIAVSLQRESGASLVVVRLA